MGELTRSARETTARALLAIALLLGACAPSQPAREAHRAAQALVGTWLEDVSRGSGDAGWDALSSSVQAQFGGDPETFVRAAANSEWDSFRWSVEPESAWDDGDYTVFVRVENAAPEVVPAVLRDYALAGPWYEGTDLVGIVVFVGEPPLEGMRITGGGASDWP
jgi:hypothetical protein